MKMFCVLLLTAATTCLAGDLGEAQIHPTEGFLLLSWDETGAHTGHYAVVYGKIVQANNVGHRCYLNFHEDYRQHLSVSISESSFANFPDPPERLYDGKRVVISGYVAGEGPAPEMRVNSPDQIIVVPDDVENLLDFARDRHPHAVTPDELRELRRPRPDADVIRIGTYNVLNLFDEFDDPYRADEVMSVKPRAELERLARRIRKLDADVLCMQEVENRFFLERFVRAMLPEMGYDHVVLLEANNSRGIDCAILSRLPVGPVTTYQHLTFEGPDKKTYQFQRDFLRARIEGLDGFAFDVFSVHLKSKYGGAEASEPVRMAEAAQIRRLVDAMLADKPDARFVICGDFNDYWDSNSLKTLRGSGKTELTCPGTALDEEKRVTYNQEPYRSQIDFIVCSPEMRKRYVEDSYEIIPGSVENSGSDHNPSVAAFRIK